MHPDGGRTGADRSGVVAELGDGGGETFGAQAGAVPGAPSGPLQRRRPQPRTVRSWRAHARLGRWMSPGGGRAAPPGLPFRVAAAAGR